MPDASVPRDGTAQSGQLDAVIVALRVIAGLLIIGAAYLMSWILIPILLAIVLAIALSPVANWLEARGLGRSVAVAICALTVLAFLVGTTGLIAYQAGSIVQQTDKYLDRFSVLLAHVSRRVGGERLMQSMGVIESRPAQEDTRPDDSDKAATSSRSEPENPGGDMASSRAYWERTLRRGMRVAGRWVVSGIGGALGLFGGVILFLSFLFYILQTRDDWLARLKLALYDLGLRPRDSEMVQVRKEIVTYLSCLALISLSYVAIVSLTLWAIGVPQPLLWGVLAGLLEVVPYFGPLIAAAMPTVVSLSLGTWWQPLAVLGLYVTLHTIEGYVVTPLLYGGAVKIDPVLVLAAVLFFGWLWGPFGLAIAMPATILLRGLLVIAPDTPALDALMDADAVA